MQTDIKERNIRAVLFDLDGTLFDRATSVCRCIEDQHHRFSDLLNSVPQSAYVSRFVKLDARGYTKKDVVYAQLADEYSLRQEDWKLLYDDFYANYHRYAVAFPGLKETLQALRSMEFKLGLITNGGGSHQRATIQAIGIEAYFEVILISEVAGLRKPDTRIFQLALDQCGVAPQDAVYIGDHPEVDISGARKAGLHSVWKRDTFWGDCLDADAVIDDLAELPGLLVAWNKRN